MSRIPIRYVAAVVCAALAVGGGAAALMAQNRGGAPGGPLTGKVCCIDVVQIFNEYQRQKDLAEEMKNKQDALQRENEKRRQQIDTLQATLDKMDPADPTYMGKTREALQMQIDYKNWFDLMQADMQRETGVWTARIYKEIVDATGDLCQKQGYDMAFYRDEYTPAGYDPQQIREQIRGRKILYWNPALDATQSVLENLNAAYRAQPRQQMLQVTPLGPSPAQPAGNPPPKTP